MIILGAINKITKEYIYPKIANKDDQYICPECNKDVILHLFTFQTPKKRNIYIPNFILFLY